MVGLEWESDVPMLGVWVGGGVGGLAGGGV